MTFVMCKTGIFTLSPSRLWHGISLLKAGWVLHEWCHYIFLAQLHRFKIDDPDICLEFMQRNLYSQEGAPILCNWSGPCYRTRQQVDEGSGRTQQPADMARWFLVAPELSRLAAQAEDMVGLRRASSSHHHDLSDVLTNRYNENVQKLNDVL